jgi:hypothetical protein
MLRRPNNVETEKFTLLKEHAEVSATTTIKVYKVPAGRTLRLDRASYINVTGLVGDGTNAFAGTVQNSSTVAATLFNTDTGDAGGASLAADTFVEGTLSATSANCVFVAGDIVSLVLTEDTAATLPAGTLILEGRLF